jgi:four helix bundle protein
MLLFAAGVIRKLEKVRSLSPKLVDQLTRSSSSIGANYAEACNGASKLDFRNKIYISKKEAAETRFWIDLCIELKGSDEEWDALRTESAELVMILQAIINTLKDGSAK